VIFLFFIFIFYENWKFSSLYMKIYNLIWILVNSQSLVILKFFYLCMLLYSASFIYEEHFCI